MTFTHDGTEYTLIAPDCVLLGCVLVASGKNSNNQGNTPTVSRLNEPEDKAGARLKKRGDLGSGRGPKTGQGFSDQLVQSDQPQEPQSQGQNTEQSPSPQTSQHQEPQELCEAQQSEKSGEIVPWVDLEMPTAEVAQRWLDLKRPGYSYWRAVPGKRAAALSPAFTDAIEKNSLFGILTPDVRMQMKLVFFRKSLNYCLSAGVLYSLVRVIEDLDQPSLFIRGTDIIERHRNFIMRTEWDPMVKVLRDALREHLNTAALNIYSGDPFLASMRDKLIIWATDEWCDGGAQKFRVADNPTQVRVKKGDALLRAFNWDEMTLAQAISLRSLMEELFDRFKLMLYRISRLLINRNNNPIETYTFTGSNFPHTGYKIRGGVEGYVLAIYTLDLAIEYNPELFAQPQPGQYKPLLVDRPRPEGPLRLNEGGAPRHPWEQGDDEHEEVKGPPLKIPRCGQGTSKDPL
ncbi:MAG: hypothetical protein M1831_000169 [Alyxoria varia]|nr:MAG: hypothetical protein M1831_000169 [Alyxoria varia]